VISDDAMPGGFEISIWRSLAAFEVAALPRYVILTREDIAITAIGNQRRADLTQF
jgi:hypothetical protein